LCQNFIEVFVDCPVQICRYRDPKRGHAFGLEGIDPPYENPKNPEVHVRTDLLSPAECVAKIMRVIWEL
jgi:adenylylsulfate kinase